MRFLCSYMCMRVVMTERVKGGDGVIEKELKRLCIEEKEKYVSKERMCILASLL